ncbi:hypothetical protein HNP33_003725 [Comamonas odontotermitis]|uniref:Uncharacterized protein n=1 Tax=Comamonas odontotermitis TaxID=379895 RepID=A0ABR6RKA2_9BURK|nr:hypothetical protein [Comamonas odontotermitis]MBB6579611.1 hypothetical protein [Comamonas odontotermitis]
MTDEIKMAQEIKRITENMKKPAFIDLINIMANEKFAKFKAYQRAGFDARQALELVIREVRS